MFQPSPKNQIASQETPVKRCRDVNEGGRSGDDKVFGNDYETPNGTGMEIYASEGECGLVGLEPTRVAEILKDRPSWFRDCRAFDVLNVLPTANGGTIELLYIQLYAPTTLAPARDFWLLRYTSVLEDGSLVICERSLKNTQNGPSMPLVQHFVRAEMLPSGYLIRPCEGGGSIIHVVDHMDLELMGLNLSFANGFPAVSNAVLCAKASMSHRMCLHHSTKVLREHRSEWADNNMNAYSAAAIKVGPCGLPRSRIENYGGQVILPLAHIIEHEEINGMDENAVGTCAELIFAPIDASFADDAPLLPSGFCIIPLDYGKEASNPNQTLDLASALDVGPTGNRASNDYSGNSGCIRSVMTIAFEFVFKNHMQEHVASMARQYVRSIISSIQRVALALSPSYLSSQAGLRTPLGTPEAQTLARWICNSYREPFVFQLWMFDHINFVGATWVSRDLNLIMRGTNLCSSPCGITQMHDNEDDQQPLSAAGHYGNDF
ncbi:hypothetical protein Fmac_028355 [Flemingia macrophylla]|uniref:START domain-containing protein n=1 Tax=Flemingia macrophylla TaxID=520843 RepID=A0ABD1L7A7_9FABA